MIVVVTVVVTLFAVLDVVSVSVVISDLVDGSMCSDITVPLTAIMNRNSTHKPRISEAAVEARVK